MALAHSCITGLALSRIPRGAHGHSFESVRPLCGETRDGQGLFIVGRPLRSLATWLEFGSDILATKRGRSVERRWRLSLLPKSMTALAGPTNPKCTTSTGAACPSPMEIWRIHASPRKIAVAASVWSVNCRAQRIHASEKQKSSRCTAVRHLHLFFTSAAVAEHLNFFLRPASATYF